MTQKVFIESLAFVFCECSSEEFIKKCDSYGVKDDVLAIAKWVETNIRAVDDLRSFVENSRKCALIFESVSVNPSEYSDNKSLCREGFRLNSVFGAFYRMCEDAMRSNVHFAFAYILSMFCYVPGNKSVADKISSFVLRELNIENKA